MIAETIKKAANLYIAKIKDEMPNIMPINNPNARSEREGREYLYYLCTQVLEKAEEPSIVILLSFVQGILWSMGDYEISELNDHLTV